tara:strand:+ start:280 stop:441 length:162 start_codon:yes stop_codon:yes gene_type:complete
MNQVCGCWDAVPVLMLRIVTGDQAKSLFMEHAPGTLKLHSCQGTRVPLIIITG